MASLLLVAAPRCAEAQDSTFTFRGIALGTSEAELHKRYPWGCTELSTRPEMLDLFLATRNCTPMLVHGGDGKYNTLADFGTFGGAGVKYFTLYYWQDRLSLVRIVLNATYFDQVAQALTDRYGQAGTIKSDTVRTRMGLVLPNTTLRWDDGKSAITATRYAGTIDESEIQYTLKSWEQQVEGRRAERRKARAGDL